MADSRWQQALFPWTAGLESRDVDPRRHTRRGRKTARRTVGVTVADGSGSAAGGLWLTADEATTYLGLPTRKALYAAVARGQVPARRFGRRRLRFNRVELDALLGGLAKSTGVH